MRAVLLLSGGIDSTTLLAWLVDQGAEVTALIFDYGQSLQVEIDYATRNAIAYDVEFVKLRTPLDFLGDQCSLLQGDNPVQVDRTLEQITQGTPTSYVPFRNGIFLAYAVAYGESEGIEHIYAGANGLNSGNYWDDTTVFAQAFTAAAQVGTQPAYQPEILFPFAERHKWQIVQAGAELDVDYACTWSCYQNGPVHCGRCDSCVQRAYALDRGLRGIK